ncbi:M48 family metallopeptidase [Dyadobacter crusticola]|uniref:M48 family metallopeptidase n=1 Tax=Dyadobacter crusticola TaxID=292407 RepID=UPI0004E18063|nr:M48 family metallopeptidase [Dyadobacter crusticola]
MQQINVRYHDGRTSAAHDAVLELMPGYWLIHPVSANADFQTVRWDLPGIVTEQGFTNLAIFRYGDYPQQTIECKDDNLPQILKQKYPDRVFFRKRISDNVFKSPLILLGFILFILGLLAATYLFVLPFVAEKAAKQIPQDIEVRLGDTMYSNLIAGYEVDSSLSVKVNDFAKAIDFKTSYPIQITVVKENELNAFALPGGHIVVFDGILKKMKTKEELAALLAHEVSHVHYQHSLRSVLRSLSGYLFVSLVLNDVSGIVAVVAENSNMLVNLTYSRELEMDADRKAMGVFQAQGISLKGFVDLFKILDSESNNAAPSELLSTHPLTADRIQHASELAREQTSFRDQSELQKRWLELRKAGAPSR